MTSTTQVVNTLSSIKTNTHTHTQKPFQKNWWIDVDCNLLIPIPFQLFLPTCQICVFCQPFQQQPALFPPQKKHGNTVKTRRVPGSPTNLPLVWCLRSLDRTWTLLRNPTWPRTHRPNFRIPWGMIFGTPKK